jgi:hypothetical protein
MYLLLLAVLSHETFVADVGEVEALVDDDVGGVLVRGGVSGAPGTCAHRRPSSCSISSSPSCLRPYHFH